MAETVSEVSLRPTEAEVREQIKQPEQMGMMYFNFARSAASYFDIRIFFGQASITPKGEPTFEEQLCVIVSPEFARTLRDTLTTSLEKYEKQFGQIRPAPQRLTEGSIEPTKANGKDDRKTKSK